MASFSTDNVERTLAALVEDPAFQRLQVSEFRHEFGEDANGDPALWIYVMVPDDVPLGLAAGPHFEERLKIRAAVQTAGWTGGVYTRFRRVSEDPSPRSSAVTK